MDKALVLLQIQKQALEANTRKELGFHVVNATKKLVDYKRAIFWTVNKTVKLQNVSGNALLDQNGPHGQWIQNKIRSELKDQERSTDSILTLDTTKLSAEDIKDWLSHAAPNCILLLFRESERSQIIGGLWLERETAFKEPEFQILEELTFYYSKALVFCRSIEKREFLPLSDSFKPYKKYVWFTLLLLAVFPVQESINAPAEIVAVSSRAVSVPFDGVLMNIDIKPGERVTEGYPVAKMDVETLALQANTSSQAVQAAQSRLSRLRREVLSNPERKTELNKLLSEIKTKEIEADYATAQLDKAIIKAPRTGIAIFADVNDIKGKPVKTGQSIMSIADPDQIELLVRVPVQAMIPVENGTGASFFPNAAPLSNYNANVTSIGYQASEDSDGLLTYKIRANFNEVPESIRIGWKGVAKIKGDWTILGYKILRRPLITIRNVLGV